MINVWEIAVKHEAHPDQMKYSAKLFEKLCQEAGYFSIEGKIKHVITLESLKRADDAPRHRDPFDKILLAQAKSEEMAFLTHDGMMMYYNENCIIKI